MWADRATDPRRAWGQPPELAAAIAFLINEGSFVSGQCFVVDGGWEIAGGVEYGDSRTM